MSGGGYDPPAAPTGPRDCARLIFTCILTSVDPAVLATIAIGDICDVLLVGTTPPDVTIQVLTRPSGRPLGAIVDRWAELRDCLEAGAEFEAQIGTVSAPIRVTVRPRRP
jgi:hypothetical protein